MTRSRAERAGALLSALLVLAGCGASTTGGHGAAGLARTTTSTSAGGAAPVGGVPRFDHIVVVWEAHLSYAQFTETTKAPFLRRLATGGAQLTDMHSVGSPAKPNFVALFSGSTHGLTTDACPNSLTGPNLATGLAAAHLSFVGYSEGLPRVGAQECRAGNYVREHNPWVDFADVPARASQPFTVFPSDFATLPAVAFVVPNLVHDMRNGSIAAADRWLRTNLGGYVTWARAHDSLLVVVWDHTLAGVDPTSHVPAIFAGAHVRPGAVDAARTDHYTVLRTIEDAFGIAPIGMSAKRRPATGIWR